MLSPLGECPAFLQNEISFGNEVKLCSEFKEGKIRDSREVPPMAVSKRSSPKAAPGKTTGKPTVIVKDHKDSKINELERKLERLENIIRDKIQLSPRAVAENCLAVAESFPAKAKPEKTKEEPTFTTKRDRATKINELERKLESLASMIQGLKEEVQERAMEDSGAGNMDPVCNTCLVRKKGAALFPCGHTFCWKCTSDLRRGKGRCPICKYYFWNVISVPEVP